MPTITLEIPADIAEQVDCNTPEIYYLLVQLGLKAERRKQAHEAE